MTKAPDNLCRQQVRDARSERIRVAVEYIQANYDRPIRLADMARQTDWGVSQFVRQFKRNMGLTPMQYVTQMRIGHAKRLLATTDLGIRQVAELTGYNGVTYLSRMFKRMTGRSPLTYRAECRRVMDRTG